MQESVCVARVRGAFLLATAGLIGIAATLVVYPMVHLGVAGARADRPVLAITGVLVALQLAALLYVLRWLERHVVGQRNALVAQRTQLEAQAAALREQARELEFRMDEAQGMAAQLEASNEELAEALAAAQRAASEKDVASAERHQLEAQLRQAQKMEAVGRLAGGVAHDFNNLLTVILSYAAMLLADDPGGAYSAELGEIQSAAARAASLTRQLLAFSRSQLLRPEDIDLNGLVANVERMLRRLIGEDIDVSLALATGLGMVRADSGQLEQVIMNLAVNARDAMPEGGRLTIETANVDLCDDAGERQLGASAGPYVMLSVADTGHGISNEMLSHIFEPFFTTKEPGKGTGLGLATVYGIVKQSGGDVRVESEPGRGTCFRIYLPRLADDEAFATADISAAEETRGGRETILLVEDDDAVRVLAHRGLAGYGYRVLVATSGADALELCARHPGRIDMMASDVVMPGMTSQSLVDRVTTLRPDIKVLFMSGYAHEDIRQRGRVDARAAFLQKPFSVGQLAREVRQVLDARSAA